MSAKVHRRYSLQNRLLLFMLAILVGSIVLLAIYVGHILRVELRGRLGERQQAVATMVAADIDKTLMVRWKFLEALADAISPALLDNREATQSFLDERQAARQLFDGGIIAFAVDGSVVAETPSSGTWTDEKHAEANYLRDVLRQGQGVIAPLGTPVAGSASTIAISVPVRDSAGVLVGALTGVTILNFPQYLDHLQGDEYGVTGDFFLVMPGQDAFTTLARKTSIKTRLPSAAVEVMLEHLAQVGEGTFVFVDPAGEEVIASDQRVTAAGWHLVAALPTAESLELVGNAQRSMLLVAVLLMLVSGLLMKWVLQRELAPMRSAARTLAAQADTNEPARALQVHRHDEIGRLIMGFNGLLESLGKRELALRESEDRYRLLIESTAEAIWVIQDGFVRFANAAMTQIMGYSVDELRSRPFIEFVHPDSRELVLADCRACIEGAGNGEKHAIRICAIGDRESWLEMGGVRINWEGQPATLSLARDITEQRRIKLELAHASELLERTSELAHIGGWHLDMESRQLHWTRETYRIHEVESDEPITLERALSFYPKSSRSLIAAALQTAIDSGRPWDLELPLVTAQGRSIWVRAQGAPEVQDGKIVAVGGAFQDVTLRRQMESQILQSEKLAAIGQLAAGVAHEINNPIAFVNSNLGALKKYVNDLLAVIAAYEAAAKDSSLGAASFEAVDALKAQVELEYLKEDLPALLVESAEGLERVKNIVMGLKDFTRADSTDIWQSSDLRAGIESTLKVVWNELKYKCEVITDFAELPPVECVPGQLNQVFMNLLVNAAHAISERGVIHLRTGREQDTVWVEVADTGQGIEPALLPRIFDPFFTTKAVGKGTGLGLSVSLRIVERHHGRIEVESVLGKGTTFRVCLPIRQPHIRESLK